MFEFAKLIQETGIPKGVVNVISGFGEPCGKALTSHNLVEKIAFTGGPETARHIIRNSCLLYTSPSPRDLSTSRMPSSA